MSSKTLARKLADVKPGTIFVGVDLGLDSNTAVHAGARRPEAAADKKSVIVIEESHAIV